MLQLNTGARKPAALSKLVVTKFYCSVILPKLRAESYTAVAKIMKRRAGISIFIEENLQPSTVGSGASIIAETVPRVSIV